MQPTQEQLELLKKCQLEILAEFVKVCEQLGLRYYLMWGTLLGAIRHQGYIPWDDDIDVGMPREDYEKFMKLGQKRLPKHMFIQSCFTDEEYLVYFSKIRNSNTTFIETLMGKMKINHGIFIDIYPIDNYPENIKAARAINKKAVLYDRRIMCEYIWTGSVSFKLKQMIKKMILGLFMPSVKKVACKREQLYKDIPSSKLCIIAGERKPTFAEWYGEGVDVFFEGMNLKAPKEWDKLLTHLYGDYMKLPPVEERVAHHDVDVIDVERPYTDYI